MATRKRDQIDSEDTWLQRKIAETTWSLRSASLTANERIVTEQTLQSYRDQLAVLRRQGMAQR